MPKYVSVAFHACYSDTYTENRSLWKILGCLIALVLIIREVCDIRILSRMFYMSVCAKVGKPHGVDM